MSLKHSFSTCLRNGVKSVGRIILHITVVHTHLRTQRKMLMFTKKCQNNLEHDEKFL